MELGWRRWECLWYAYVFFVFSFRSIQSSRVTKSRAVRTIQEFLLIKCLCLYKNETISDYHQFTHSLYFAGYFTQGLGVSDITEVYCFFTIVLDFISIGKFLWLYYPLQVPHPWSCIFFSSLKIATNHNTFSLWLP